MGRGQGSTATVPMSGGGVSSRATVRRHALAEELRQEMLEQAALERPVATSDGRKTSLVFEDGRPVILTYDNGQITHRTLSEVLANDPEALRQAYQNA
jgi:hypothetical protein